jgi:hypothetical protein
MLAHMSPSNNAGNMMSICLSPLRRVGTIRPYRTKGEPVMPLLRPLDPAFPIERQIAIDAAPSCW